MIKKSLIKLRRQPKHVRNNVALGAAGAVTFAVFSIWAFNLPSVFEDKNIGQAANVFSSIADEVEEKVGSVSDIVKTESLKDFIEEDSETKSDTFSEAMMSVINESTANSAAATSTSEARVVRIATTTSSTSLSTE